ncbi:MAG: hypothetical protein IIA88_01800, partial [Bacteroidetes bacterium]|nr:hypothetical protein [Bacteroidota bacterium]
MKLKVCLLVILFLGFSYKIQSQIPAENGSHPFGWSPASWRGDIKIKWESNRYVKARKDGKKEILAFEGGRYIDNDIPLPAYFLQFPGKYLSKFELYNETYQALDAASQKLVPANLVPAQLQISIDLQYQNRRPVSLVTFIPLRKNDITGQIEKLVSFQYKFTESPPAKTTNITRTYAANSVLADGDWYKLAIISSGIYKIDFNFLSNIGVNPGTIDPQNIKIFGNGGGMLPQANASFRYDDLEENAISVKVKGNGSFDYLLFYAQGPHTWSYDSTNKIFTHTQNLYSDTAFYFLTVDITPGLRIQTQNSLPAGTPVNTFDDHFFHEQDLVNMGKSGRLWFGEVFDLTLQRDFNFNIPGLNDSEIKITSSVMGISSKSDSEFKVKINSQFLGIQSIPIQGGSKDFPDWGEVKINTFNINSSTFSNNSSITITLSYNKGSSGNA